jgi:hypothetical protein
MSKHPHAVGKGHSGNTPNLPVIREDHTQDAWLLAAERNGLLEPNTKRFRMGKVQIMVSPPHQNRGWHMSISREDHYPSWDEVAKAWYGLIPGAEASTGVMVLPPKVEYVNVHNFCFHVHELVNGRIDDVR